MEHEEQSLTYKLLFRAGGEGKQGEERGKQLVNYLLLVFNYQNITPSKINHLRNKDWENLKDSNNLAVKVPTGNHVAIWMSAKKILKEQVLNMNDKVCQDFETPSMK